MKLFPVIDKGAAFYSYSPCMCFFAYTNLRKISSFALKTDSQTFSDFFIGIILYLL